MGRFFLSLIFALSLLAGHLQAATVSDEFTRADSTDIGTNWDSGYSLVQACQIVSGRVRTQAAGEWCAETWNANSFGNNQWAQITIANFADVDFAQAAVFLRAGSPPTLNLYRIVARRGDP